MTIRTREPLAIVACILLASVTGMAAPAQRPTPPKTKWAATDVLPLTCAQAWVKSGKTYSGMLAIVRTLARVSLANRDLTFPNTREAGLEAGKGIATDCKADPNGLLFAMVDKQVRLVADNAADK